MVIHAHGIVNRDLKPDHLMLREDGSLDLADFGIAKDLGSRYERTRRGEGFGTPLYLSPEQALGQRDCRPAHGPYSCRHERRERNQIDRYEE